MNYFSGIVIHGQKRGRQLGFPTANLQLENAQDLEIELGIYACKISVLNQEYDAVAHIGPIPTFADQKISVEIYIFDFNQEIYGEKVSVNLIQFIRTIEKFDSIELLKQRIEQDCDIARKILNPFHQISPIKYAK